MEALHVLALLLQWEIRSIQVHVHFPVSVQVISTKIGLHIGFKMPQE